MNLHLIEYQPRWRVALVARFAQLTGVLIHVEGFPFGSSRLVSQGGETPGSQGPTGPLHEGAATASPEDEQAVCGSAGEIEDMTMAHTDGDSSTGERALGFYWLSMPLSCEWVIGYYNGDRFLLCGDNSGWFPEEFEEIGNLIERTDEAKDGAPKAAAGEGETAKQGEASRATSS